MLCDRSLERLDRLVYTMQVLGENIKVLLAHHSFFAEFGDEGVTGTVEVGDEGRRHLHEDVDGGKGDDAKAAKLDERTHPAKIDRRDAPGGEDARGARRDRDCRYL